MVVMVVRRVFVFVFVFVFVHRTAAVHFAVALSSGLGSVRCDAVSLVLR